MKNKKWIKKITILGAAALNLLSITNATQNLAAYDVKTVVKNPVYSNGKLIYSGAVDHYTSDLSVALPTEEKILNDLNKVLIKPVKLTNTFKAEACGAGQAESHTYRNGVVKNNETYSFSHYDEDMDHVFDTQKVGEKRNERNRLFVDRYHAHDPSNLYNAVDNFITERASITGNSHRISLTQVQHDAVSICIGTGTKNSGFGQGRVKSFVSIIFSNFINKEAPAQAKPAQPQVEVKPEVKQAAPEAQKMPVKAVSSEVKTNPSDPKKDAPVAPKTNTSKEDHKTKTEDKTKTKKQNKKEEKKNKREEKNDSANWKTYVILSIPVLFGALVYYSSKK